VASLALNSWMSSIKDLHVHKDLLCQDHEEQYNTMMKVTSVTWSMDVKHFASYETTSNMHSSGLIFYNISFRRILIEKLINDQFVNAI